jgi:hypothetical protein
LLDYWVAATTGLCLWALAGRLAFDPRDEQHDYHVNVAIMGAPVIVLDVRTAADLSFDLISPQITGDPGEVG